MCVGSGLRSQLSFTTRQPHSMCSLSLYLGIKLVIFESALIKRCDQTHKFALAVSLWMPTFLVQSYDWMPKVIGFPTLVLFPASGGKPVVQQRFPSISSIVEFVNVSLF